MKKNKVFLLILALIVLLVGCGKEEEQEEEVIKPVILQEVKMGEKSTDLEISGNVKPKKMTKVAFKVPGTLETMNVEEGSKVSKGQTLMSINTHNLEIGVRGARAQRDAIQMELDSKLRSAEEQAKSTLDYVNEQLEKVRRLEEKGAVSTKTLDELEVQQVTLQSKYQEVLDAKETAVHQLGQAQAMLDLSESKLQDAVVESPVSGTVINKRAEVGESIIPGNPALVIADLSVLEVEVGVSDNVVDKIKVGQKVQVELKGLEKELEGTVSNIGLIADSETRTFGVKIDISNKDNDIKSGMIANVKINLGKVSNITIPADAIIEDAEGTYVFVYDPETEKAHKRMIETGDVYVDEMEVIEGLEDGESIVVQGQYRLNDGEVVAVRSEREDD